LRLRVGQGQHQNSHQSQIFHVPHGESPFSQIRHFSHQTHRTCRSSRFYFNVKRLCI
jgi:hypothetical protein